MSDDASRYTVSEADNSEMQFCNKEQTILANRKGITDLTFLQEAEEEELAKAYEILLSDHPFREGNARAIKLCTDILAVQTDRPILLYDKSEEGQQRYIDAAKAAILKDYKPMTTIFHDALKEARA